MNHSHHLLATDCPASVPPLLTGWALTSSFYDTVGLSTVNNTLTICWTQTVQPHFLPYFISGPISVHLMTQWVYTPSFTLLTQCAHTASLFDPVGLYLLIYLQSEHYLAIDWTQTVQPYFVPYLHSGPIPPHLLTQGAPPSPPTGLNLFSLSFSVHGKVTSLLCIDTDYKGNAIFISVWTLCNVVIKCPLKSGSLLVSPPVFRQPTARLSSRSIF